MSAKVFIRVAAALILVHFLGHLAGHSIWDKPEDPKLMEIVTAMKSHQAEFMGATKSIADYYHGYSTLLIIVFAMTIAILWTASGSITEHKKALRGILLPIGVAYVLFGVIEYVYFFPFAASMSFLAGICVLIALFKKRDIQN